jgi:phosphatidate cytidylyltransferase
MRTRIITALLGLPILVFILNTGGIYITGALIVVTHIALMEFYSVFIRANIFPFKTAGLFSSAAIIFIAGYYPGKALEFTTIILVACTMLCFFQMILQNKERLNDLGITLLGLVYISVLMGMMLMLYNLDKGNLYIWLVFILAWIGDTFAYFIGITFGKHKLCPAISPKKSIEGSVAGLVGSILGSALFGYIAWRLFGINYRIVDLALVGLTGGVLAQLGDLTASLIKRHTGVKDYGNIMPGHGGILDRFDSVLFAIPVVYYYTRYFI